MLCNEQGSIKNITNSLIYFQDLSLNRYICKILDRYEKNKIRSRRIIELLAILHLQENPSIIKFVGSYQGFRVDGLVFEYAENNSLRVIIDQGKGFCKPFEWNSTTKTKLLFGLASALSYLHSEGYVHRDLKPENILLDENYECKLNSFGLCRVLLKEEDNRCETCIQDVYSSPELMNENYSYSTDVYSFACIVEEIIKYSNSKITTNHMIPFIKAMKNEDPSKRPIFEEIMYWIERDVFIFSDADLEDVHLYIRKIKSTSPYLIQYRNDLYYYINENTIDGLFHSGILVYRMGYIDHSSEFFKLGTLLDDPYCKMFYVSMLSSGHGVAFNFERSVQFLYSISMDKIDPNAYQLTLIPPSILCNHDSELYPNLLINMSNYLKSERKEISFLFMLIAANQGDSVAQYQLAMLYKKGAITNKNLEKAAYYFYLSARQKNPMAIVALGKLYLKGKGVKQDPYLAIQSFLSASYLSSSEGYYELGNIFYNGLGVKQNYSKTLSFYKIAESIDRSSNVLYKIGYMYKKGYAVSQSNTKMMNYLADAASKGSKDAQYQCGKLFLKGNHVKKNVENGIMYLKLAADQANSKAQYLLGKFYSKSKNGFNSPSLYYIILSAMQGNKKALYTLGLLYENGNCQFLEKSINRAVLYYRKSYNNGFFKAKVRLDILERQLFELQYKNYQLSIINDITLIDYFNKGKGTDIYDKVIKNKKISKEIEN